LAAQGKNAILGCKRRLRLRVYEGPFPWHSPLSRLRESFREFLEDCSSVRLDALLAWASSLPSHPFAGLSSSFDVYSRDQHQTPTKSADEL